MKISILERNNIKIAVYDDKTIIKDEESALNLIGDVAFNYNINHLIIPLEALSSDFFNLSNKNCRECNSKICKL